MLWFLTLAARRGFLIESDRDEAVGVLAQDAAGELAQDAAGELAMTRVTLRPDVRFGGDRRPTAGDVAALHHEAHDLCFIARSVKTDVRCEPVAMTV